MRRFLNLALTVVAGIGVAQACDFKTEPAALPRFYRSDGWKLPPINLGELSPPVTFSGPGAHISRFGPGFVLGLTARLVIHDAAGSEPNLFVIPRQEFERGGQHRVMSSQIMVIDHWIWRYEVDGKVVAYSVGFTPVEAHRENGKWKIDSEVGCIFWGTFVDDTGEGVFRVLSPGWMTRELIPKWALKRESPA